MFQLFQEIFIVNLTFFIFDLFETANGQIWPFIFVDLATLASATTAATAPLAFSGADGGGVRFDGLLGALARVDVSKYSGSLVS